MTERRAVARRKAADIQDVVVMKRAIELRIGHCFREIKPFGKNCADPFA